MRVGKSPMAALALYVARLMQRQRPPPLMIEEIIAGRARGLLNSLAV
jgi:hypothetical protein